MSPAPRILALITHPDDEMLMSGTLALQVQAGMAVTLAVACNGNMGGLPDASPAERAAVRFGEMQAACAVLGVSLEWLDYGDDGFMGAYHQDYQATEAAFRDLLRRVDPDLMIVPALDDYHQHHRAAADLALNASLNASNPAQVSGRPPSSQIPLALMAPPLPGTTFAADLYVDITSTFDRKIEALRCHQSQHGYLQSHHRTDVFTLVEALAAGHGAACGVRHAEAFSLCRRFNRLAPIQRLAEFFPSVPGE
jgi:LmbE family N-acetylglucosaminyl deacetylase